MNKETTLLMKAAIGGMFVIICGLVSLSWADMKADVESVKADVGVVSIVVDSIQNDIQTLIFADSLGYLKRSELEKRILQCELEIDALQSSQP